MSTTAEELTCQELVELVTDYLEDALPADRRLRFDEHLAVCPHCREYLAQLRTTVGALALLEPETIPPAIVADLLAAFRTWNGRGGHHGDGA